MGDDDDSLNRLFSKEIIKLWDANDVKNVIT